jgi:RHS repeat-associated protein
MDSSFSTISGTAYGNSVTYTGRQLDWETGLYYYRNRYYHAQLGNFVSRDPIGYEGSQWNLYQYAESAPVGITDADGLGCTSKAVPTPAAQVQRCKASCKSKGMLFNYTTTTRTDCVFCGGWIAFGWQTTVCVCKPKPKCKPCNPPVGTVTYQSRTGHSHGGADPHVHVFTMQQNPNNCQCCWSRTTIPGSTPPPGSSPFPGPAKGGGPL